MNDTLSTALYSVLRPLAEILQHERYGFYELNRLMKRAYLDAVAAEMITQGITPTAAKLAIQTGFTRKDVALLRKEEVHELEPSNYNRVNRVLSGWMHDPDFQDKKGRPAILSEHASQMSLKTLITRYSGDMPYKSMKDEMLRVGVLEERGEKLWELAAPHYLSKNNSEEGYRILGEDVGLLISTIGYNLKATDSPHYQRKVKYDNVPADQVEPFKKYAFRENQKLLLKLNKWLAERDRDVNPNAIGQGRACLGVGVYYFEELEDGATTHTDDGKQ